MSIEHLAAEARAAREAAWARWSDDERRAYVAGVCHVLADVFAEVHGVLETPSGGIHELVSQLQALHGTYIANFVVQGMLP